MIGGLVDIVAPVFICAAIGFVWVRLKRPYDTALVTRLVSDLGAPCLVLSTLIDVKLESSTFAIMAAAAVAAMAASAVIGGLILKMGGVSIRTFLPSLVFGNCGNMGLPLCLLAFGQPGLALAIVFFSMTAVGMFTFGVAVSAGSISMRELTRIPILYAVILALGFIITGYQAPAWFANTTRIVGGMTVPLMLITLGVSLAGLRVESLGRSVSMSLLRLVMGFATGVAVAAIFGLEGPARGVLILQSAMPVAVFNYLFAQRYRRSPEEVAGVVVISTAVSFLTLPLLLMFVL